jgi:hypothetical protein
MSRISKSSVYEARFARISGSPPEARTLGRRSKIALTAGFVLAAAAVFLVGPNLGTVFAEADDNGSFWRAEHARKAAARQPRPAPQPQAVARGNKRDQAPSQMSAYAPARQSIPIPPNGGPFSFFTQPGGPLGETSTRAPAESNQTAAAHARSKQAVAKMSGDPRQATSRLVCVRLCDGYFFPAPNGLGATEAGCASACPNAPTRLYSMRSDRIVDAVATRGGASYARLPVALHYTRAREATCSCGAPDPAKAILADTSLRRGDRFMTENGFVIYQGGSGAPNSRRNFKSVTQVRDLPRQERNLLLAMERVSLPRPSERLAAGPAAGAVVALGPARDTSRTAFR